MKLSEFMRTYRRLDCLSIRQYAQKCGLSYQYVSNLESGKVQSPTINALKCIAQGSGISFQELLVLTDEIEPSLSAKQLERTIVYMKALNALKEKEEKDASI